MAKRGAELGSNIVDTAVHHEEYHEAERGRMLGIVRKGLVEYIKKRRYAREELRSLYMKVLARRVLPRLRGEDEVKTLKEIARFYGKNRSRIGQIETELLNNARALVERLNSDKDKPIIIDNDAIGISARVPSLGTSHLTAAGNGSKRSLLVGSADNTLEIGGGSPGLNVSYIADGIFKRTSGLSAAELVSKIAEHLNITTEQLKKQYPDVEEEVQAYLASIEHAPPAERPPASARMPKPLITVDSMQTYSPRLRMLVTLYNRGGYFYARERMGITERQYYDLVLASPEYLSLNYDEAVMLVKDHSIKKPYGTFRSKICGMNLILATLDTIYGF